MPTKDMGAYTVVMRTADGKEIARMDNLEWSAVEDLMAEVERRFELVKVVRCRDCKHRPIRVDGEVLPRKVNGYADEVCPFICTDYYYNRKPDDDFFCKWGERKDDGIEDGN